MSYELQDARVSPGTATAEGGLEGTTASVPLERAAAIAEPPALAAAKPLMADGTPVALLAVAVPSADLSALPASSRSTAAPSATVTAAVARGLDALGLWPALVVRLPAALPASPMALSVTAGPRLGADAQVADAVHLLRPSTDEAAAPADKHGTAPSMWPVPRKQDERPLGLAGLKLLVGLLGLAIAFACAHALLGKPAPHQASGTDVQTLGAGQ